MALQIHVTVDFFDDLLLAEGVWDEAALREMVRELARRGIAAIRWVDHGRLDGGFWDSGSYLDRGGRSQQLAKTVPDPLGVVCDEAHRQGQQAFAVIKPWDFAFRGDPWDSLSAADASSPVRLPHLGGMSSAARFIRENPHMRCRLHPMLIPDPNEARLPIRTMRIWHDAAALPAAPEVSLFISHDNDCYERYEGPMQIRRETRRRRPPVFAPAPLKEYGPEGDFACIELNGLDITAPFVCVRFDGPTGITNTLQALVEVLGPQGEPLAFTYGLRPRYVPVPDEEAWRNIGVVFDGTNHTPVTRTHAGAARAGGRFHVELDALRLLAIARGRNEYLTAPVEFVYPEVQQGLLDIIDDALDSGVDGVDIRPSTHTESLDWEDYGFNEPNLEAFRQRFGVDPVTEPFSRADWRNLRGEFFDAFLERVSRHVRGRGKMFSAHLYKLMRLPVEEPCWQEMAYHWRHWLTSGILDGATFKTGDADEEFYREALSLCGEHGLKTNFARKPSKARPVEDFERYFQVAKADSFDSIELYELAVLASLQPNGRLAFRHDRLWDLVREHTN